MRLRQQTPSAQVPAASSPSSPSGAAGGNKITGYAIEGDSEIPACSTCGDGTFNLCDEEECKSISKEWESRGFGYCKFEDGWTSNGCALVQNKEQAKAQGSTQADKTLRDNPGKSIKFGQTAVVCGSIKSIAETRNCNELGAEYSCKDGLGVSSCGGVISVKTKDCNLCCSSKMEIGSAVPESRDTFQCRVQQFELPQDVTTGSPDTPWYGKVIGTTLDFGRAWIGAMGEPHYLVYYETFPPEAEEAWMYSGWDVLVTAFATGAVMNLGVGGVKVAATGVKAGGLYTIKNAGLSIKALLGKEVKTAEREALENEFKSAMSARLAKEFGGTALMRFGAAKAVEQNMVMDTVDRAGTEIVKDAIDDTLQLGNIHAERYLDDLEVLVSGEGEITAESVGRILPASKFTDEEVNNAAFALNDLRTGLRDGRIVKKDNLMSRTKDLYEQKYGNLPTERFKELYAAEFKDTYKKMEAGLGRAVLSSNKEKIGIIPALKWAAKKLGLKSTDPLDKAANEMAMANYERMTSKMISRIDTFESKTITLGGKEITASTPELSGWTAKSSAISIDDVAKGIGTDASEDEFRAMLTAWLNLEDPVVKTTIWERAGRLVKQFSGTPALDKVPTFKRQAVMATSLALSYVYMMQESKAEKYKVAQNTVMLSRPPMWTFLMKSPDDPGNYNYKDSVKLSALNKDTWVQMKIPGVFEDGGMPLYLASPCKADVSVTWGKCKCKEYASYDKLVVKYKIGECEYIDEIKCAAAGTLDEDGKPIDSKANPPCPKKDMGYKNGDKAWAIGLLKLREEDIKYDVEDKTPKTIGDVMLRVQCHTGDKNACKEFSKITGLPEEQPACVYSQVTLNARPARENGAPTLHKICTDEGWWAFLKKADESKEQPCIQISVDATSMSNYGNAGFDPNFCRISKGKGEDMAQVGIEAGVLIGGVALTLFPPTGPAGVAVLMGVSGGLGAVGSKVIDITRKWPERQY